MSGAAMRVVPLPAPAEAAALPAASAPAVVAPTLAHPSAPALAAMQAKKQPVTPGFVSRSGPPPALLQTVAAFLGIAAFVLLWGAVSQFRPDLPGPTKTWEAAVKIFSDPFYVNGPNDQGIGWNVLSSLKRVGIGFGLAALVGIPLGFVLGRFSFASSMAAPVISLLRPVSPLAWLPIGLLVFKKADPAATWTIFICAIWPMILNTAAGVRQIPADYLNVAKVLNLSEWKVFSRILFPAALPHVLTGVRLSIGVAWLVIVAAEMLTGGVGIGFWVWDEWNNLKVEHIIIAILVIGVVGLALEQTLLLVAKRFSYGQS
jgi:nitrate/nitrite transport system permease protein